MNDTITGHGVIRRILIMAAVLALAACASTPPPVASLQGARQAISHAEQARAAEHAPLELAEARDKLRAANNAVENDNMMAAQRLADESQVLAELAIAKTELEEARKVNDDIVQATEMLREEMQRKPEELR